MASFCADGCWAMFVKPKIDKRILTLPVPEFQCQRRRLTPEHCQCSVGLEDLYTLGKKKGEGAYGVVQAAKANKTGMLAVVKTIDKERMHDMELACIANELEILSFCDHPNIIRLFHMFEEDRLVHCAMQYCSGGDLADKLDSAGHFSAGETQTVMKQVLHGLHYLHNTICVAHRDMKLENLLLKRPCTHSHDLKCKIIDFGFARGFKSGMNSFYSLCGTPGYLAPEIARQQFPYNEKCDVFSCGVMLYEMLSGDMPWGYDGGSPTTGFPADFYRGQLTFTGENWEQVSGHAKLLAARMCRSDPQSRLSALDCLNCEWLSNDAEDSSPVLCGTTKPAQDGLRKLAVCNKTQNPAWHLISEALQYVAYHIEDHDIESHLFEMFDRNKTGTLTKCEFSMLCQKLGMSAQESAESFQKIDANCDGAISFNEFLTGCIRGRKCSNVALLSAFYAFDRDHNGSISLDELKIALSRSSNLTELEIQRILDEADHDRNGEVDFEEFKRLLPLETSPVHCDLRVHVTCTKYSNEDLDFTDFIKDAPTIPL